MNDAGTVLSSRRIRKGALRLLLGGCLAALAACGGSGEGAQVVGLSIVQASADVRGCTNPTSVQLTLVATLADGSTATLGGPDWPFATGGAWSSDDPAIATVVLGLVTGVGQGTTTIRAALGGHEASVPANVLCGPLPTPARVPVSDLGTGLQIGGTSGGHAARCIAIDADGRIHTTWFDPGSGLRYARSIDGGLAFLPSVLLVGLVDAPAPRPIIACAQEGQDNVYVVYVDQANNVRCLRSPDAGVSWLLPGALTGLAGAFGEHSAAVRGTTVMVFSTNSSTMARSTDSGQTFPAPTPNLLSSSVFNDVLMDPRDTTTVVAISDSPDIHFRVSADDGATFAPQVDSIITSLFYSDYAIDQLGNVFGVSQQSAWVVIDVDTQTPALAASALTGSGNPGRALAVDVNNVVYVVRESSGSLLLQSSPDQGATLTPEIPLDTGVSTPTCAASFAHPGVGILYIRAGSVFYFHN